MELIAKISKGTRMDQVYIPKNRNGFQIGSYVILKPLETEKPKEKPYFYNIKEIEPVKLEIVYEIIQIIDNLVQAYENIIITGSFLDKGFNFNDVDIILISQDKLDENCIKTKVEEVIKIRSHIIIISHEAFMKGMATDPLYQMMLSKAVAKRRVIYNLKREVNYRLLDLHLLKSKLLVDNFDSLNGNEKYYLVRNMVAISLFIQNKKISNEIVDKEILTTFKLKSIMEIKQNMVNKKEFIERYRQVYKKTFNEIIEGISHGSKQE